VFAEEQRLGQKFLVSIDMELDLKGAADEDDLTKSIHYGEVAEQTAAFMKAHTFKLIETAAQKLAQELLASRPLLKRVSVTIKKPWAPVGLPLDTVAVSVSRKWHSAVIACGSNLEDRRALIEQGIKDLCVPGIELLKKSDIIETKPVGPVEQGDFLNGCLLVRTVFSPEELLACCRRAEEQAHRQRTVHWGPRTLDLDIIAYDDLVLETDTLTIPHPEMQNRLFVLEPMAQICPDWVHPVLKKTVRQLMNQLQPANVRPAEIPVEGAELVENLPRTGIRVVFQGEEGAYTQAAMFRYFGEEVESFHVVEWSEAVECVEKGQADFAVLPIENSNAGAVSQVTDLLIEHQVYIVAEEYLPVAHALLGLPGAKKEDIQKVYSHPQALMQCAHYLEGHKDWQQISMKNTAFSARKVLDDQDITQAAIASEISAKINGLQILERQINDNKNNVTRFIILAKRPIITSGAKKISICVELNHEVGSLYKLLSYISIFGLNMNKIESRPIPGKNFEYRFFIDFEGNISQPDVVSALRGIRQGANKIWFLGNY
jgi:2-amino-4-hydroxy-6-hydroxymethyldihydropteridine diphosphokinase/dihydroneopterin aldolase